MKWLTRKVALHQLQLWVTWQNGRPLIQWYWFREQQWSKHLSPPKEGKLQQMPRPYQRADLITAGFGILLVGMWKCGWELCCSANSN